MIAVNQLVGQHVGKYSGPVLVVGGALSVPAELLWLKERGFDFDSCLVISANEHAMRAGLKPHFACVNDDIHSQLGVQQEPRMRKLMPDTLLLSRHWWADCRSTQLMACNSGMKALLYAAILGANPAVAIGFDHYRGEKLYFHDADAGGPTNPNSSREMSHFTQQTTKVKAALGNVPVRTVSGPLTRAWPQWSPDEIFKPRGLSSLEREMQSEAATQRYACVVNYACAFEGALMPEGTVFAVTAREMAALRSNEDIQDATDWDLSDKDGARLAFMEFKRAEQTRMLGLIAKVRSDRRGVRRGIYDADLIRIIRWSEDGLSPQAIASRNSMPKEQVAWIVRTMGLEGSPVGV